MLSNKINSNHTHEARHYNAHRSRLHCVWNNSFMVLLARNYIHAYEFVKVISKIRQSFFLDMV